MATDHKPKMMTLLFSISTLVIGSGCDKAQAHDDGEQRDFDITAFPCIRDGGIVLCNTTQDSMDAPNYEECFDASKQIIDDCQGSIEDCLSQAKCALCDCLGPDYCPCTGIV